MKPAINPEFWRDKRVFLTGHTGFKGGWLALWLESMGAKVTGYSLAPEAPGIFEQADVTQGLAHCVGDIRDLDALARALAASSAEIVFHLAAQSLVRPSYRDPIETYSTNVMGTANVLEAAHRINRADPATVRAVIVVTTDKCYQNQEWIWPYRETDALGGHDPYSSSKACAELVASSYRSSFPQSQSGISIATARAGNVIGGGDWATDRLVPDAIKAFSSGATLKIRNPAAIRPWQHVLEPLSGYLLLAQNLVDHGAAYAQAWNFGPGDDGARNVGEIATLLARRWGDAADWRVEGGEQVHEAQLLKLDSSKARTQLNWRPRLTLESAVEMTADWYRAQAAGGRMRDHSLDQISRYASM